MADAERNASLLRKNDKQKTIQKTVRRGRSSSGNSGTDYCKSDKMNAVVVDSGAFTIKAGHSSRDNPTIIPNCIMKAKSERKRLFIGNQISECRDCSGLYYLLPCERGYITKWDVQKPVWDYTFSKNVCPINDYPVILTQPLFNFKLIQDCMDEIFFEEYEASSMLRLNPTDMARLKYNEDHNLTDDTPVLIIDTGFSFTHVIPYIKGNKYLKGIKRLNVGGKLLTNHLKDIISYRQYNVMEETYVINQVKEDTCYVAEDVKAELKLAEKYGKKNNIVKNYVLPDFNNIRRGYIQDPDKVDEGAENCQILRLNNERFLVPEILFHPSDIGMKSMGIAEAIVKSIFLCPLEYQRALARHILIIGGNCKFPGFKERLFKELRSLLPHLWHVNIYQPEDPILYTWQSGSALLSYPNIKSLLVSKKEYDELGSALIQQRFNHWNNSIVVENEEGKTPSQPSPLEEFSLMNNLKGKSVFGKHDIGTSSSETTTMTPTPTSSRILINLSEILQEAASEPGKEVVGAPGTQSAAAAFAEIVEKNAIITTASAAALASGAAVLPNDNENTNEQTDQDGITAKKIRLRDRSTSQDFPLVPPQEEDPFENLVLFPFGRNSYI
ncbi:unnamed protein product [Brassicogethes aeneus]|uniref:Actin-related protein 6 n=1 Tax=Brassicogethes aeneus TaxID=1431903 RepID=A0A9P0BHD3_BRAAE|nr:unnamed protein product [Brassicogethes aeneus]